MGATFIISTFLSYKSNGVDAKKKNAIQVFLMPSTPTAEMITINVRSLLKILAMGETGNSMFFGLEIRCKLDLSRNSLSHTADNHLIWLQ